MSMDRLAAMEAFVRVVDAGSFSGAAKKLRLGQPAAPKGPSSKPTKRNSRRAAAP
jgi:hypothetical protein